MPAMTIEAIRARIETLFRAYNDHDVDAILANFTDDVIWEDPNQPAVLRGRQEAGRALRALFSAFPDLHFPKEEIELYRSLAGGRAGAAWHMVATMTGRMDPPGFEPTGRTSELAGTSLYEFRDGLICRHRMFYDALSFSQRLGVMPGNESLAFKAAVSVQTVGKKIFGIVRR